MCLEAATSIPAREEVEDVKFGVAEEGGVACTAAESQV